MDKQKKAKTRITRIMIRKVNVSNNIKALANIIINDALLITGIKIINGKDGLFVAMPSKKNLNGYYFDTVSIFDEIFKKEFSDAILDEYYKSTGKEN